MSNDRIYYCRSLEPKTWRCTVPSLTEDVSEYSYSVSVRAGGPFLIDELYLFTNLEDAIQFYSHDVEHAEFFDEEGNGHGFDEISISASNRQIAVRQRRANGSRRYDELDS